MVKISKKILMCILTFLTFVSFGAVILTNVNFSKADVVSGSTAESGFYVEDGAQIKAVTDGYGLRWKTYVEKEYYDSLADAYGAENIKFHTLIGPATATFEVGNSILIDKATTATVAFDENNLFAYNIAILYGNVSEQNKLAAFGTELSAKAYVKITQNGSDPIIVYAKTADVNRSMRGVAITATYYSANEDVVNSLSEYIGGQFNRVSKNSIGNGFVEYSSSVCGEVTVSNLSANIEYEAYIGAMKVGKVTADANGNGIISVNKMPAVINQRAVTAGGVYDAVFIDGDRNVVAQPFRAVTKILTKVSDFDIFKIADATVESNVVTAATTFDGYYVLGNNITWDTTVHNSAPDAKLYNAYSNKLHAGGLTGTFDGNGYTISGMSVKGGGLFGLVDGGTIKNVAFENVNMSAITKPDGTNTTYGFGYGVAGLAYQLNGATLKNVYMSSNKITHSDKITGFVAVSIGGATSMDSCIFKLDEMDVKAGSYNNSYGSLSAVDTDKMFYVGEPNSYSNVYVISPVELSVRSANAINVYGVVDGVNQIPETVVQADYLAQMYGYSVEKPATPHATDPFRALPVDVRRFDSKSDMIDAGNDYGSFSADCWMLDEDGIPKFVTSKLNDPANDIILDTTLLYEQATGVLDLSSITLSAGESIDAVLFADGSYQTNYFNGKLTISGFVADGNVYEMRVVTSKKGYRVGVKMITKILTKVSDFDIFKMTSASASGAGNGYYLLGGNITWEGDAHNADPSGYLNATSIKNTTAGGFSGTFDGNGYTITGMKINGGGIFGLVTGGTIKNVAIKDMEFSHEGYTANNVATFGRSVAGLAYSLNGATVENVYMSGDFASIDQNRAIVATTITNGTNISNSIFKSTVGVNAGGYNCSYGSLCSYERSYNNGEATKTVYSNVYLISPVEAAIYSSNGKNIYQVADSPNQTAGGASYNLGKYPVVNQEEENALKQAYVNTLYGYSEEAPGTIHNDFLRIYALAGISRYDDADLMKDAGNDYSTFSSDFWTLDRDGLPIFKSIKENIEITLDTTLVYEQATGEIDLSDIPLSDGETVNQIVFNDGSYSTNYTDGVLTIEGFVADGEEYEMAIITSEKDYIVKVRMLTKILKNTDDLKTFKITEATVTSNVITSATTFNGYYLLGNDIVWDSSYTHDADPNALLNLANIYKIHKGGLTGTFDGNGYTISGMKIYNGGLFGLVDGGTIKNVAFDGITLNCRATGGANISQYGYSEAGLAYELSGATLENVYMYCAKINTTDRNKALVATTICNDTKIDSCIFKLDAMGINPNSGAYNSSYGSLCSIELQSAARWNNDFNNGEYEKRWSNVYVISPVELAVRSANGSNVYNVVDSTNRTGDYTMPKDYANHLYGYSPETPARLHAESPDYVISVLSYNNGATVCAGIQRYNTSEDMLSAGNDYSGFDTSIWQVKDGFIPVFNGMSLISYVAEELLYEESTKTVDLTAIDLAVGEEIVDITFANNAYQTVYENGELTILNFVPDGLVYSLEIKTNQATYVANVKMISKVLTTTFDFEMFKITEATVDNGKVASATTFGGYYVLGNDLTWDAGYEHNADPDGKLNSATLTNIHKGGLTGTFDGNGHTITGMKVYNGGLFGLVDGGTIKNVGFADIVINGVTGATVNSVGSSKGGLAYQLSGATLKNVYMSASNISNATNNKGFVATVIANDTAMDSCIFVLDAMDITAGGYNFSYGSLCAIELQSALRWSDTNSGNYQKRWSNVYVISPVELAVRSANGMNAYSVVDSVNQVPAELNTEEYLKQMYGYSADNPATPHSADPFIVYAVASYENDAMTVCNGIYRYDNVADMINAGNSYMEFDNMYWDTTGSTPVFRLNTEPDDEQVPNAPTPIVEDGKVNYTVVLPKTFENKYEQNLFTSIKEEFAYLFKKATNLDIRIVEDTGLVHYPNNRYISIGETELFRSSGLTYDRAMLGEDGVRIMTKDSTVFLLGGTMDGTLYAVYEFMEIMFNFDVFDIDSIYIDTNVTHLDFKTLDITDVPDFALRHRSFSSMIYPTDLNDMDNKYYGSRMRMKYTGLVNALPYYQSYDLNDPTYQYGHNTMMCLPKATYQSAHPEWYSDNGNQLCYTAHGDEAELRAMAEEVVKKTIWSLYRHPVSNMPLVNNIMLGMEDNYDFCTCSACLTARETYKPTLNGVDLSGLTGKTQPDENYYSAGAIVKFTNLYAEIFEQWEDGTPASDLFLYASADEEWLNINIGAENRAQYIRDDFYFYLRAYNNQILAPAVYNAVTDSYEPIDADCVLRDNVALEFTDIQMDWSQSYFAEDNKFAYENIRAWGDLAPRGMMFYNYIWYPDRPFWFYDGFNSIDKEQLQFMLDVGAFDVFFCGTSGESSPRVSGFKSYWAYLASKLTWDVNQDVDALTAKYFENAFGDAADIMKTLFDEERAYFHQQYTEHDMYQLNSIYHTDMRNYASYWDKDVLKGWIDDCYAAFDAIEHMKTTDPEGYNAIYCHIAAEMIYPASVYLELFRDTITPSEKTELSNRLLSDYEIMGLNDKTMWFPYGGTTYLSKINEWQTT